MSAELYRENLEKVHSRLIELGRPEVRVIAVSKTHGPETISDFLTVGQRDFGENRQNEARDKFPLVSLDGLGPEELPIYHHIGPLQSSAARQLPGLFDFVHGVSSLSGLKALEKAVNSYQEKCESQSINPRLPIRYLIQMNLTGEESKMGGMSLEELRNLSRLTQNDYLIPSGFMTMGPTSKELEQTRAVFHQLKEIRDEIMPDGELSMGMSGDWEMAVEEGATMIRLGTVLFGTRNPGPWKKDPE